MTAPPCPATIMVVDDSPEILSVLGDMLRQQGYAVRAFSRSPQALAAAEEEPPDLILLDICMPEMDGYATCERMKAVPSLMAVPVIFVSGLEETMDKVRAFRAGGVDYLIKPPNHLEVRARVETHLRLRQLQQELERRNGQLEELVRLRTQQLTEANAQLAILDKAKSDFLDLISHELRTPLTGLLGITELVLGNCARTPDSSRFQEIYRQSRRRLLGIVDDAVLLARFKVATGPFVPQQIPLDAVVRTAIERAGGFARYRGVFLEADAPGQSVVLGDKDLLIRALATLLETAVKFSKPGGTVRLAFDFDLDGAKCRILSVGREIPADLIPKFFDVFSISDVIVPGGDLGLGPPVAGRIVALFGGRVSVENVEPSGICLTVNLRTPAPPKTMASEQRKELA